MRKFLSILLFTASALSLFAQNLDADDPDGDGVVNRLAAADLDNRNTFDLDKDNDGIINSLETCVYDALVEYDVNKISPRINDVYVLVDGVAIGVVRVEMVGGNNLALNNPVIRDRQDTRVFRAPGGDAIAMRWGSNTSGAHNGQSIQFDVTIYPEYKFYADNIQFRIFQGVQGFTEAIDIKRFNIESDLAYTVEANSNRIEYDTGSGFQDVIVPGVVNVAANVAQNLRVTGNNSLGGGGAWWRATTENLGTSGDGLTKTTRMTYNYTGGSDKAELIGFTLILNNSCTATSDVDADGVPNDTDLDSDNDGCPDAYEYSNQNARVSFTNERAFGDNGTNGLNNTLEANDTNDSTLGYVLNGTILDSNNNQTPDHLEASVQPSSCPKVVTGTALTGNAAIGNVGISTVPNTANQAYFANGTTQALDVVSKTKGVGLPLVSNANLPPTATPGTVLWNTDENCLMLWHADNGSGSAGWACVQRAGDGL